MKQTDVLGSLEFMKSLRLQPIPSHPIPFHPFLLLPGGPDVALRASPAFAVVGGALRFSESQFREWRLRQLLLRRGEEQGQQHHALTMRGEEGRQQQQNLQQQSLQPQLHEGTRPLKLGVQGGSEPSRHGPGDEQSLQQQRHQHHQQASTEATTGTWWALDSLWRGSPAAHGTGSGAVSWPEGLRTNDSTAAATVPDTLAGPPAGRASGGGSVAGGEPAGGEQSARAVQGSSAGKEGAGSATSSEWRWPEWLPVRLVSEEELSRREEERVRMVRALKARTDKE